MRPSPEDIRAGMRKKAVRKKSAIVVDVPEVAPKPKKARVDATAAGPKKTPLVALPATAPSADLVSGLPVVVETPEAEAPVIVIQGAGAAQVEPEGAEFCPIVREGVDETGRVEPEGIGSTGGPVPRAAEETATNGEAAASHPSVETRRSEIPLPEGFSAGDSGLGHPETARRLFRRIMLPMDRALFDSMSVEEASGWIWSGLLQVKQSLIFIALFPLESLIVLTRLSY